MENIEAWFHYYAGLGLSVIPVKAQHGVDADDSKKPLVDWKEYQARRATSDEITAWCNRFPLCGIAIVTGSISGNLIVVDDDRSAHMPDPRSDLYIQQLEQLNTATDRTYKGRHFYTQVLPGTKMPTGGKFLPGLDVRGEGGYVIVPPTLHWSGNPYLWEIPLENGIAILPESLWTQLFRDGKPDQTGPKLYTLGMFGVGVGSRNDTAASFIGRLLAAEHSERIWPSLYGAAQHWNNQNHPPLSEHELRTTFDSICAAESRKRNQFDDPQSIFDLSTKEMQPPGYAIKGLVLDGLTQLFGKPKAGKSFMALQMALAVATGRPLFPADMRAIAAGFPGGIPSTAGDVLYLALEDSDRRLYDRIRSLTYNEFPKNLYYSTRWPLLHEGGLAKIDTWVRNHPNARLVVVDTVAAFVGSGGETRGNVFRAEYRMFRPMWELSQNFKIPVLVVDHASKGKGRFGSPDVFDAGSGTLGSQAAVDTVMMMEHDDKKSFARITFKGRDVERGHIDMEHQQTSPVWQIRVIDSSEEKEPKKGRVKKDPSEDTGEKVIPMTPRA